MAASSISSGTIRTRTTIGAAPRRLPADNNGDKRISTEWYVVGMNYMINRDWGVGVRIPTANRAFTTDTNFCRQIATPGGVHTFHASVVGDIELMGMYTGFSKDMSKGLIFGVKLPTGNYTAPNFDRDTQIGTGSTDLILGGFWRGMITGDNAWQYFSQIKYVQPVLTAPRTADLGITDPAASVDAAAGITYNNWYHVGPFDKVAPLLQVIVSHREHDSGLASNPGDTGYDRLFISPGIDITKVVDDQNNRTFKLYGDVEVPVYQQTNGNQLVAPYLFKIVAGYTF